METVEYKNLRMTIWDVGGQTRIRTLWRYYYSNSEAVIFVVDSSDRERIEEAAEELHVCIFNWLICLKDNLHILLQLHSFTLYCTVLYMLRL